MENWLKKKKRKLNGFFVYMANAMWIHNGKYILLEAGTGWNAEGGFDIGTETGTWQYSLPVLH